MDKTNNRFNLIINKHAWKDLKYPLTKEKILKAFNKSKGVCPYCHTSITLLTFSLDHIKPYKKGGTNHLNNLIACCNRCNIQKSIKSVKEFKSEIGIPIKCKA